MKTFRNSFPSVTFPAYFSPDFRTFMLYKEALMVKVTVIDLWIFVELDEPPQLCKEHYLPDVDLVSTQSK